MGSHLNIWNVSVGQINTYYYFVLLTFIFILNKYKKKSFALFVIFLFYTGLISAINKNAFDLYKIFLLLLSIYWFVRLKVSFQKHLNIRIKVSFILFSISFLISAIYNNDYFTIIFSQYARYFILITVLTILLKFSNNTFLKKYLDEVILDLIIIQIFLSIVKLFLMGPKESLVGSITSQGGAAATIIPILALFFYWIKQNGKFKRKDWIFAFLLIIIGFAGAKRAVWFIFPVIITSLIFYVPDKKIKAGVYLFGLIAALLVFYAGLRLSPTLNPENKTWGSFNPSYAFDYAIKYSFGDKEKYGDQLLGRNSTTNFILDKLFEGNISKSDWIGSGLVDIYTTDYEEFANIGFYTKHKGSVTGAGQTFISNGYLGLICTLLFAISIIQLIQNKRLRWVVLLFFFWEYFYYTGSILREYSISFLFVYILVFADRYSMPATKNKSKFLSKPKLALNKS